MPAFIPGYPNVGEFRIIHCKLFNDTVTEYLCSLRRRELSGLSIFSCTGCGERDSPR